MSASEHQAQFYETDAFLLDAVAAYIGPAIQAGEAGLVVLTPEHRAGLEARLAADGLDVSAAHAEGRYQSVDAAELLNRFTVNGSLDPARFREIVGELIKEASSDGRRVRVFGEMVELLAIAGQHSAAVYLEQIWNDLLRTVPFSLLCAYSLDHVGDGTLAGELQAICAEHDRVLPAESFSSLPDGDERLRAIAELQRKARWLEAEIVARRTVEARLREVLESERAARAAAEAAIQLRDEFVSIAAHELKTPLTSLSGQAQLALRRIIRDGELEPEQLTQTLQAITSQSQKLARLLNRLLDVTRISEGQLALDRQRVDLVALVHEIVALAQVWSESHAITVAAPDALEVWIDPPRFEQVLSNLLDNAIKYSPVGGPIEVCLSQSSSLSAELSVRDFGLGIPAEKREQIFERFYQAHGNGYRSGMGLGLYISRQIARLHGGDIRVEFPATGGSRFVVNLPIEAVGSAPRVTCNGHAAPTLAYGAPAAD